MLQAAFTLLGTTVTWLEAIAFAFALACVVCAPAAAGRGVR